MRRRLRKKLHARHADEVLGSAIFSEAIGPALRELRVGDSLAITPNSPARLSASLRRLVQGFGLQFVLARVPLGDGPAATDPYPVPGAWLFRLSAREFPSVAVWSEVLPHQIGRPELLG
jgi:hypothetical protein